MSRIECDVGVVGAGVAGLTATAALKRAGLRVICLEATGRVGGRIWTVHDPLSPLPVELGAEFVHGRPEEIWSLIDAGNLTAFEHTSRAVHLRDGRTADESETSHAERLIERR